MGVWGQKIYDNDIAQDVKTTFEKMLLKGVMVEEITNQLTKVYCDAVDDPIDGQAFWLALADTQWEYGVLLPTVKLKALFWIDNDHVMDELQLTESAKEGTRKRVLDELKAKLLSPMPQAKLPKLHKGYVCNWKYGDVFAFLLESSFATEKGLYGRYALVQKVDEYVWYPDRVVPIVYMKLTSGINLPKTVEEYDALEYVQTSFTRYERRFWPIDMRHPEEDVAKKSRIKYEVDEYGYLPEYRIILLNTSARVIPKKLLYVGNYMDSLRPKKEFVPHDRINIGALSWGRNGEIFEETVIKKYCGHNLRQLDIYKVSKGQCQGDGSPDNSI